MEAKASVIVGAIGAIKPKSGSLCDLSEQWHGTCGPLCECACGRQHIIVQFVDSQAIARPRRASGVASNAAITTMKETRRIAQKA